MSNCALCATSLIHRVIQEGDRGFCCAGCHAVFRILVARNQLEGYQESPIFHQALRSGLISNPLLLEQMRSKEKGIQEGDKEKIHFEIQEMWCPSCAEVIQWILLQEKGVTRCLVDYATDAALVGFPRRCFLSRLYLR